MLKIHRNEICLYLQAATGGIININDSTKRRYTLNDATAFGLIERRVAQRIESAEKAYAGFTNLRTRELLSLGQALKKGLCYYEIGSRLMEFQCATGENFFFFFEDVSITNKRDKGKKES